MGEKPEYEISTSEKDGILELVFKGEVEMDSVGELFNKVFNFTKSTSVKNVLIDVRALKGRFGYTETYFRVRNYPPDIPRVNTAYIDLAENADYQNFHENTSVNAGLSFKWFTDIDAARVWLKEVSQE
jgi:hypothetical protein